MCQRRKGRRNYRKLANQQINMLLATPDKFCFRLRTLNLPLFLRKAAVFLSNYLLCIFSIFPYIYLIDCKGTNTESRFKKTKFIIFCKTKG